MVVGPVTRLYFPESGIPCRNRNVKTNMGHRLYELLRVNIGTLLNRCMKEFEVTEMCRPTPVLDGG